MSSHTLIRDAPCGIVAVLVDHAGDSPVYKLPICFCLKGYANMRVGKPNGFLVQVSFITGQTLPLHVRETPDYKDVVSLLCSVCSCILKHGWSKSVSTLFRVGLKQFGAKTPCQDASGHDRYLSISFSMLHEHACAPLACYIPCRISTIPQLLGNGQQQHVRQTASELHHDQIYKRPGV